MTDQPGHSPDPERAKNGVARPPDQRPDDLPTRPSGFLALPDDLQAPSSSQSMQLRAALPSHRFTPGQVLGGRYKVTRLVASGGMGSVYEVEDLQLRCRVALKTVLWFMAGEPMGVARLRREIQLARRVTHPNVCRLFDLGSHHSDDDGGEVLFLTMEFLDGETLSSRLRRTGPMSVADAVPLARQLIAALAAAHEAGVVHRDFKCANVMLVPRRAASGDRQARLESPDPPFDGPSTGSGGSLRANDARLESPDPPFDGPSTGSGGSLRARPGLDPGANAVPSELRAVVTDFGLARSNELGSRDTVSLTGSGVALGTPAYMAPEQVEGEEASPASDIYALGLVLYQMTTGRLPFAGKTPVATAAARLKEDPPSPREYVPDLPGPWVDLILRCLEREPANRFPSAASLADALDGGSFALVSSSDAADKVNVEARPTPGRARGPSTGSGRTVGRRWQAVAAGVVLLLLGAAGLMYRGGTTDLPREQNAPTLQSASGGPSQRRRSVAVLGFKNLSGRPDAAWLSTALSEMLGTDLAAGEQLRIISGEEVARAKRDLGLGDAESYEAETLSRIRRNLSADYVLVGSYADVGEQSRGEVRLQLHLQDAAGGRTVLSTMQRGTESQLFDLVARAGKDLRRKFSVKEPSTDVSGRVRSSMPKSPESARYHAEGLEKLRAFDAVAARDLLSQAVAADPGFALAHMALADAWAALGYRETHAKESARRAFELSEGLPRAERLLIEGSYRLYNGEPDAAVVTYQALHAFFPDDIDYGLALARAQVTARKPGESLKTLAQLRTLPPPAGDDPRINLQEANAYRELPDFEKNREAASRAVAKARKLGSRLLLAEARLREGLALRILGRSEEASTALEEAKALFAEAGDRFRVAVCLQQLASIAAAQGKRPEAQELREQVLETYRQVGNRRAVAFALDDIALELAKEGRLEESKARYQESIGVSRELNDASRELEQRLDMSQVIFRQGDLAETRRWLETALEQARKRDEPSREMAARTYLGSLALAEDNLAEARKSFEETAAAWSRIGHRSFELTARLGLARVLIAEARPAEAEPVAREAAEELQRWELASSSLHARAILAEALLAQGKSAEALREIEAAESTIAQTSTNLETRLRVEIMAARVRGGGGDRADFTEAGQDLEACLAEAARTGFVELQLEASLALAELETQHGDATAGQAQLAALAKDAAAKGFARIARNAAAKR